MSMELSPLFTIILQLVFFVIINKGNGEDIPTLKTLLIFGDSSSDTGNNNYIPTIAKGNHYPYGKDFPGHVASGRFSNGKLVPDILGSLLGIKDSIPPFLQPNLADDDLLTGVTFASGGSGFDDRTAALTKVIPVSQQTVYFRSYIRRLERIVGKAKAQKIVNEAFFTISAGTNDFVFNYYDLPSRRSEFTIDGYQNFILNRLHDFVKEIYELGGRTMLIPGFPPVGCLPLQMTVKFTKPLARTCVETENADAQAHNTKLVQLLPQIEASLNGTRIFYGDVYTPIIELITNPQKYGLIETTRGCCGTGLFEAGPLCKPLSPVCADASKYLFFDSIHPGETAYRHVTERLIKDFLQQLFPGGGR